MAWMPPLHPLLSPITADTGATIEQVQLKPLYYAAQKDALARAGDDEDDQFFELAKLATGLSEKELDQLKRPDYVTIAQFVHDMSTRPASFFLGEPAPSSHEQPVQLLLPVDAAGRTHAALDLEMPALRATKVMKKLATAQLRALRSARSRKLRSGRKLRLMYFTPDSTIPFLAASAGGHGLTMKPYPWAHSA